MESIEIIQNRILKLTEKGKHKHKAKVGYSKSCPDCIRITELKLVLNKIQRPLSATEMLRRERELRKEERQILEDSWSC